MYLNYIVIWTRRVFSVVGYFASRVGLFLSIGNLGMATLLSAEWETSSGNSSQKGAFV